jgi:putative acetyltransferase
MIAPTVPLRPATDTDGPAVGALIAACFAEYPGCLFAPEEFPELSGLASWIAGRGGRMWVIDGADGAIDGCICASPLRNGAEVELHKFYLASHRRGSGLADTLLGEVEAFARTVGASRVILWSDTRFTRAHSFYRRNGFQLHWDMRAFDDVSDTFEFFFSRPVPHPP